MAVWLSPVTPNPVVDAASLRYALPRDGRMSLAIYDATGRLVRTLLDGQVPAGLHEVAWDGRDDSVERVRAGLYFVRLTAEGRILTARMVLVR